MKVAHLLVLALACVVLAEALTVPLHRVQRTPAQKRAHFERIRNGDARRAVVGKYARHIRSNFPQFASALADLPTDPFKNFDDVRLRLNAIHNFSRLLLQTHTNAIGTSHAPFCFD